MEAASDRCRSQRRRGPAFWKVTRIWSFGFVAFFFKNCSRSRKRAKRVHQQLERLVGNRIKAEKGNILNGNFFPPFFFLASDSTSSKK